MAFRPTHLLTAFCCSLLQSNLAIADHRECEPEPLGAGQTPAPSQVVVSEIIVESNPIFEDDDQAIWLHHLANKLHVKTKPHVTLSRLSFETGDTITLEDLEESERLLRRQRYFRAAEVNFETDCNHQPNGKVSVKTWDHWTLYPRISFSRSGGENKYSYGLKDDNLLGLGIRGNFKYFSDEDRTGYGMKLEAPITHFKHTNASISAFDNDDGYQYGLGIGKPFYTLNTKQSQFADIDHGKFDKHINQNGDDLNVFETKKKFFETGYGWSRGKQSRWINRWAIGITADEKSFNTAQDSDETTIAVPDDRRFIYPWLQFQTIEDDFETIPDVHFIHRKEDHHLGWHHRVRLGLEADNTEEQDDVAGHLETMSSKGFLSDKHLLFASVSTNVDFGVADKDFYKASTGLEYFYNWKPNTKLFIKTELTVSENNYLDQPLTIGGDLDADDSQLDFISTAQPIVRGYPSQYQHGNKRWQMSVEARHYPGIELYRLIRVAWVGFLDAGRAWGDRGLLAENEQEDTISSIGIGLRLASLRSSGNNIIHIDLARTLTSGEEVKTWEIRAQARHKF